ncbi:MAG: hypothetical protein LBR79_01650 [Oscillospiraceae bacterium]|jgi:hypothetical protein|nr:hypothetical protein [Oscillospiraceae bacterium]
MNDKIKEKLKNKDFLKKIIGLETKEEVKKAFSEEGLEISEKEVEEIGEYINACMDKLSKMPEDDLEKISGGAGKSIIWNTIDSAAGFLEKKCGVKDKDEAVDIVLATGMLTALAGVIVGIVKLGEWGRSTTWWKNSNDRWRGR